ncbi:hypothetical protein HY993_01780 [Candidatus Micrarchaeota archaeon]|nr:hypothetical protein [Candidatus Micrarchaeota archaeon]
MLDDDLVLERLSPNFCKAAQLLEKAVLGGQKIVLRYDKDADGIISAIIARQSLEALASKLGKKIFIKEIDASAVFSLSEAKHEFGLDKRKFTLVLLDHGVNSDSADALDFVKKRARIIALDHHPLEWDPQPKVDALITPFIAGGHSGYCTGLLAFKLSELIAPDSIDESLAYWAMQADKSGFALDKEFEEPLAIEFFASLRRRNRLRDYEELLSDKRKVKEYFDKSVRMTNALGLQASGLSFVHEGKNSVVCEIPLEQVPSDYPPRGRVLQVAMAQFEKPGVPLVGIGYTADRLSFRANGPALKLHFDAGRIIGVLKGEFSDIESGGGHPGAASLKTRSRSMQQIRERAVELSKECFE